MLDALELCLVLSKTLSFLAPVREKRQASGQLNIDTPQAVVYWSSLKLINKKFPLTLTKPFIPFQPCVSCGIIRVGVLAPPVSDLGCAFRASPTFWTHPKAGACPPGVCPPASSASPFVNLLILPLLPFEDAMERVTSGALALSPVFFTTAGVGQCSQVPYAFSV